MDNTFALGIGAHLRLDRFITVVVIATHTIRIDLLDGFWNGFGRCKQDKSTNTLQRGKISKQVGCSVLVDI